MSSDIAIADSVWARSTTFKGAIIGNSFCCFTPVYSFAYPLRICFNNNDNDPSGSLLGSFLKYTLKDWDIYPTVSLNVAETGIFFGTCEILAHLMACVK